ncbi:MAG: PorT family protein [Cyclobacteriaceae bacterium]|nr:PorT family protein [Cyclobacteriaceae bacterium]
MKKYLIGMALLLFVSSAFAQMEAGVGIKGGLNVARFNVKYQFEDGEDKDYTGKAGFHVGVFGNLKIKKFTIQPELLFSQQGSYFKFQDEKWKAEFNYFTIPLTVKYTLLQLDEGDLNVQAGAQYGRLLKAWANYYDFDGDGAQARHEFNTGKTGDAVYDVKEDYRLSDLALQFGAGWELPMGLSMDIRYYLGLQIMYPDFNGNKAEYGTKNRLIQVSVAYRLFRFDL